MQKPAPLYSLDLVLPSERDHSYVHFEHAAAHPFQPNPVGFTRVNVWWLADSALLTYWDDADAKAIFGTAGLQSTFLKVGSTDCYVAWPHDFVIVAFRGTEPDEWQDMLTDAKIKLVPWRTGKVHRGFKEAIDEIWPRLEAELNALSPGRTVWFCGHSLGAALATLAADRYPQTRGVCTFGCPRVGDQTFAAAFNAKPGEQDPSLRQSPRHRHPRAAAARLQARRRRRFIATDGTVSGNPPSLVHFFAELFGPPELLLEIINGLRGHPQDAPELLLEHMPKAYAIWTWNDYDANG